MEAKPQPIKLSSLFGNKTPTERGKDFSTGDVYVPGGFGSNGNEKGLDIANLENIDDLRGENQTRMDKIGNGVAKFVGKTALRTLGGIATPFVGLAAMLSNGKLSSIYDNDLTNYLQQSEEALNEALPNYRTDEQKNSLKESVLSTDFWADSLLDGASFALSAYLSGKVITGGIGMVSKALAKSGNVKEAVTALKGADEIAGDIGKLASVGNKVQRGSILKEGLGTLVGAVNESALEAKGSYDQIRQSLLQNKLAAKQSKGDYSEINEDESKVIDNQAAKAANINFGLNLAMTWGTNALQMGKLFRSYTNESIDAAKIVGKAGEYSYDANRVGGALQSVVDASPKLAKVLSARNRGIAGYIGNDILSEAGQEFGQTYSDNLVAEHFAGSTGSEERSWIDSMGKALDKSLGKEGYESALLGAIIGGVTGGASGSISEAKRKAQDGQKAVDFANQNSYQQFFKQGQIQSFLRINELDRKATVALEEGRKFDWLNLRSAKFHEMVMGQYEIGKFDELIENLSGIQDATPEEAKQLLGIETDENTRAEFAKGLIEKAKATKDNYEKLIGLVGYKLQNGEIDKEAIAQASLAGALGNDMDTRIKEVKKNFIDMGFDVNQKMKDRIEKYRDDPEGKARLTDELSKQIKETTSLLRAEKDPIAIEGFNKTLTKLSKNKTDLANFFTKQTDNDNYIGAFDDFSKEFLNNLEEKTERDFANNKITPTNREDFEKQLKDLRKLEKAKKGFYDFYNEVITKGNESERLKKVRSLVEKKKNDQWLDRWYGVYKTGQKEDKNGNKVDSERLQLEPGMYSFRNQIPGKKKLSARENVVEILDRRLNDGKPEILVKTNGNDEEWKSVRSYNGIGLERISSKLGDYQDLKKRTDETDEQHALRVQESNYRDVTDLLNPEMQFYLKYKDRVIEYYQPDVAYLEKGNKTPKIKSVLDYQGTGRTITGMLGFNNDGDLVLRFYDKDGNLHTSLGGFAVNGDGKLLYNSAGQKIRVPAFAISRTTWGKTSKTKGDVNNNNSSVGQNYMRIYSEDETNQYLFKEAQGKIVEGLNTFIESIKQGNQKDFQSINEIESKIKSVAATIQGLSKKLNKTTKPATQMKIVYWSNKLKALEWNLEQQIRVKNQIIEQVNDQLAGLEERPDDYTYAQLQEDYKELFDANGRVSALDEEKENRAKAKAQFDVEKAFARQLQNDVDALELTKNKLSSVQSEVKEKITEWVSKHFTGPLAEQITETLEETIPGIGERYENKELSFDDVNVILNDINKNPTNKAFFDIEFNETKQELVDNIALLGETFEEQAALELTESYVREENVMPLIQAEKELKQIETLRTKMTADYSSNEKVKNYVDNIYDAGDEITDEEKKKEDLFVIPNTKHNGAFNPFLRTQTPQGANHNQSAFLATVLFNSKNRYEDGKYSYELFTQDMADSMGITVGNPDVADVIFMRLMNNKTGKPVMLDANGIEKASGKLPHLSVLPDANYKYEFTKNGVKQERYRFSDVNVENEADFEPELNEFKQIRKELLTTLKEGKPVRWAVNRKSYGIPRYDSAPNSVKSVINDPKFMSELLKPAGVTTDGKVDYTDSGDYIMVVADATQTTTLPGTDIEYPTIAGRTYLIDKKSKRVLPLVNRKLNDEEVQNLIAGIVYVNQEGTVKANQTESSVRANFIKFFAKNYINWGNRVSQKKLTNVGYHIDFNDDIQAPGIIFGKYTGATPEGKGIYGKDGKETTVTFTQLEEYLKDSSTSTPELTELFDFLRSTHRHVSNYNLKQDYKPTPNGKQRKFTDNKYTFNPNTNSVDIGYREDRKGYKSWLLSTDALMSPIVPVKDTQVQYDGIYYGLRNEAPIVNKPDPKRATTSKKKVKEVTEVEELTATPVTKTKSTDSRLKKLRTLVGTFSENRDEILAILTQLDEMIHPETGTVATEEEIILSLEDPETKTQLIEALSNKDAKKLENWYNNVETKEVEEVKAEEIKAEEVVIVPVVKKKETNKKTQDLINQIPVAPTSADLFVKGKDITVQGTTYTITNITDDVISVEREFTTGAGSFAGEAKQVTKVDFPRQELERRLKREMKPIEEDDFVFMDYDENLLGQPMQKNSLRKAELQDYFKTRYNLDVSIVNPKQLFGNFAGYIKKAKRILLQEETPEGAEYHEEFHVVEKMLSPAKRISLYNEYRRATGKTKLVDTQVSEQLAEGFRYYVLNEKINDKSLGGKIAAFFKQLKEFLQNLLLLEKSPKIKDFYQDIYSGKFTQKPKRSAFRDSAYQVSVRTALVDNMWYQLREVQKEYGFNLVNAFTNFSSSFLKEKQRLDDIIRDKGGKGFFEEILSNVILDSADDLQESIFENRQELVRLFKNSIDRKLNLTESDLVEEDMNDIAGHIAPANETNHKAGIPTLIKAVLATVSGGTLNSLGLNSGAEVNNLLGKLYTNLAGLQTLDQMREVLNEGDMQMKQVAETFGLNFDIASKANAKNISKALPIMMAQAQFVNHFAKQNVNYFTQQVTKDGKVKFIDEKKSSVIKPMLAEWKTAINTARKKTTFPYHQEGTKLWDYKKLWDAARENGNEVLRNLGISKFLKVNKQNLGTYLASQLSTEVTDAQRDIIPALTTNWSRGILAMQEELAGLGKDLTMSMQNAEGKTINSIVEQSGLSKRIDELNLDRKTKIEVVSLAGLKTDTGTGMVVADLGPRDSIIVQYNSILNGVVPYVFTGSKSMSWGLRGWKPFEKYADISEITDDYITYLEKEYNKVTEWVRLKRDDVVLPKGYIDSGGTFSVFKDILTDGVIKSLTKSAISEKSFAQAFKEFKKPANKKIIELAIKTHTNRRVQELMERFRKDQLIKNDENGNYQLFGIDAPTYSIKSREDIERLLRDLYVNSELANLSQWQELLGDFSYYKDPLKRITALTATKQNADNVGNLANYTAFAKNTRSSSYVKNLIKNEQELGQLTNVTIDDVEIKGNKELQKINSKYGDINVADGQGYGAMEHHRMLGFFEGWWNEDLERIYQHEVDLEEKIDSGQELSENDLSPVDDIKYYWKVVKTQYFGGQQIDGQESVAPNFLKFSVLPLLPSMTYGQPLDKLRQWMNKTGTALTSMESANKVGRLVQTITNEDGSTYIAGFSGENFDMDGAEQFVQNLNWKYYGTQTATANEPHTTQIEGTQSAKIVLSDILETPTVNTYITKKDGTQEAININSRAWVNQLLSLKSGRIAREFTQLKHQLGIKQVDDKHYSIDDKEIFHSKLMQAVQSRTDAKGIVSDLDSLFDNDQPYDYLPKAQIDGLIWGLVKKPIKHKRFGDAKVQVSTAGIGVFSKEAGTLQQSTELGFYPVGSNGTSYAMDVKLPSWYSSNIQIGELITLDARLAEVIGFRIPTQALASIEFIRVVEFLPKQANFIVVPAPITGKAGSDFDVDKMNLYYPNVRYVQGKPEYIEYGQTSDENLYVEFINSINDLSLDKDIDQARKEYKARLEYRRNYLQGRMLGAKNRVNPENLKAIWGKLNDIVKGGSVNLNKLVTSYKLLTDNEGDSLSLADKLGNLEEGLEFYADIALTKDNVDVKVVDDILDVLAKYKLTRKVTDKLKAEKEKLQAELNTQLATIATSHYERITTIAEISGYPSFEEFKNWPLEQKESIAAIDNKILEWEKATLASSNNRENLLSPNQDDNIKRSAYWVQLVNAQIEGKLDPKKPFNLTVAEFKAVNKKEYDYWQKALKSKKPVDLINPMFLEDNRQSFQAGKSVLGAIAKSVTHHVISQVAGLGIKQGGKHKRLSYDVKNDRIEQKEVLFAPPLFAVKNPYSLGKIKNINGEYISRGLSEYVNASVDVEKDDYIKYINLTIENASVYMYLLRQGVAPTEVELFMSQPVITEYTNRLALYNSESYKIQNGITSGTAARYLAIKHTILNIGQGNGRRTPFTQKELEKGIRSYGKAFQADVFEEYLKNAGVGEMLTDLMSATDFDTKDTGSSYAENALRVYKYNKWIEGNTLFNTTDFNGIDGFMSFVDNGKKKLTPLGQAAEITKTASDLFDELSIIERQFKYSHLYEDMIQPLLDSPYGVDKVSRAINKIKNGFMTYLLQNTKVNGKLTNERIELLSGDTGLVSQLLAITQQENHPLHNNYFLNQLELIKHSDETIDEVNMRKVMGDSLKQDQLYEAFLEIEDTDSELANNLIDYSILRSGVAPSPISYHQAIPIKSIADRFGQLEQYVDTEQFKNLFIRNNSKDSVILSAYNWRLDNGQLLDEYKNPQTKIGDGIYSQNYVIDFVDLNERRNIAVRERIQTKLGGEALVIYEHREGSIEGEFDISPSEQVSEAKLRQIIIAIQKVVCQ